MRRTGLSDLGSMWPFPHFAVQCLTGNSHRMSRGVPTCSVLASQQITCEMIDIAWMYEIDSLCMQQYHQLQRAQSCQSKPNQPHQQR